MPRRTNISPILIIGASLALSACVTVRQYSETELSDVARACGLAEGEVIQEAELPKVLFLYAVGPTPQQRACVQRWSRKRNLHLAYIEAIEFEDAAPN